MIPDFDLFLMKKLKNNLFQENAGFLGDKVNISFLPEILRHFKFVIQKSVNPIKNGVIDFVLETPTGTCDGDCIMDPASANSNGVCFTSDAVFLKCPNSRSKFCERSSFF